MKTGYLSKEKQEGFSLFIVVAIMLAVSLLVLGSVQSLNTESKMSADHADKQVAFSFAELTLDNVEKQKLAEIDKDLLIKGSGTDLSSIFKLECENATDGLCGSSSSTSGAADSKAPWLRENVLQECGKQPSIIVNKKDGTCSEIGVLTPGSETWANPKYIIELISPQSEFYTNRNHVYRVTVRAWGKNGKTNVLLQANYAVSTSLSAVP